MGKHNGQQPARVTERNVVFGGEFEDRSFAKRRTKRHRKRDIAKASRKKNR